MGCPSSVVRSSPVRVVVGGIVLLALASGSTAAPWRVTIRGHGGDLGETPVVAEIKATVPPGEYVLQPEGNGQPARAQVFRDSGKTFLATVLPRVPGQTALTFSLAPKARSESSALGVEFREAGTNLDVSVGGKPFTVYRTDEPTKPYFYPVFGPTGAEFTRAYPMKNIAGEAHDHPHQRSFWFTHGNVNGVDFWAADPVNKPNPKFGRIHETSRKVVATGAAVGELRTTDDWLGPDGKKVCDDERVVRFYETSGARVIDFDITIKATAGPVIFGDTKEGMFGVRVASSMDVKAKKGGKITNAEGITDLDAWGKASPWVDYIGPVAGKTVGVAILNHPASFRYPTTWHVRDYGLFAANPFGWHDFGRKESGSYTVPAGQSIRFGYRVILHEGDTASARLPDAFRAYTEPPTVDVQGE
jgi:hypothetical protein